MESILKSLNLKKKESLNDLNLIFKKSRKGGRQNIDNDIVSINKTSISMRKDVSERLGITVDGSAGLCVIDDKLHLVVSGKKDSQLFSLYSQDKSTTLFCNVPKKSETIVKELMGEYKCGDVERVGDYKTVELLKAK